MPSPLGHGLGALAAGLSVSGLMPLSGGRWRQVAVLVALGVAPDLDLLWGRHSRETHSLGAALIVAGTAAWQRWPVAASRGRIFLAVFAAWLSHPLLDGLSSDTSLPIGIQLLWPLSSEFYSSGLDWFGPISRRYWLDNFWTINLASIGREVLVIAPVTAAVWLNSRRIPGPTSGPDGRRRPSA